MSHRTDPRRRRLPAVASLALARRVLVVAACGPSNPSAQPVRCAPRRPRSHRRPPRHPRPRAVVRKRRPGRRCHLRRGRAAGHRDPRPEAEPTRSQRQFIDEAELRTLITQQFDKDTPPAYLAANEQLYKALGLIPATTDLRDLSLDLLSGGVAGFYRSDEGKLYVVSKSGGPGPNERFYFSHEYNHALQDQNFTSSRTRTGSSTRATGCSPAQAVYEGDATLLMTQWAAANLSQSELLEVVAAGSDPAVQAVLDRTPAILQRHADLPVHDRLRLRDQRRRPRAAGPASTPSTRRCPSRPSRSSTPTSTRPARRRSRSTLPADLATRLGCRLDGPAPGHVRRVPAGDLAARERASRPRRRARDAAAAGVAIGSP